jgi:hypothetical protein
VDLFDADHESEECDEGGPTKDCTVDCKYTKSGSSVARPPATTYGAVIAPDTGITLGASSLGQRASEVRDLAWNGSALKSTARFYHVGVKAGLSDAPAPVRANLKGAGTVTPNKGDLFIVELKPLGPKSPAFAAVWVKNVAPGEHGKLELEWRPVAEVSKKSASKCSYNAGREAGSDRFLMLLSFALVAAARLRRRRKLSATRPPAQSDGSLDRRAL